MNDRSSEHRWFLQPWSVGLVAAFLTPFSLLGIFLHGVFPGIVREHGPLENFQALCLGIGIVCYGLSLGHARAESERSFLAAFALFFGTFLLIEFDTRKFAAPMVVYLTNGMVRNLWLAALWLVVAVFCGRNFRQVWRLFSSWLPTTAGMYMLLAGVFWIAATLFEKTSLIGWAGMVSEELLETNACLLMLASAAATLLTARNGGAEGTGAARGTPTA